MLNLPCSVATEDGVVTVLFIVKKKNGIGEKCLHYSLTIKMLKWNAGNHFWVPVPMLKVLPGSRGPRVTTLVHTSCGVFLSFQAYSVYDEEIGYCQGQSFLAAVLLLHVSK